MKQILFLLCFAFIGLNAIAESPPGFLNEQKIELNHTMPAVELVAPMLEATEVDGNLFSLSGQPNEVPQASIFTRIVAPTKTPAWQHGNNLRSCGQSNFETNSNHQSNDPNPVPNGHNESQPDFKVGWRGSFATDIEK